MSFVNAAKVVDVVKDAGGRIVGRTKLQKIAYLLTAVGLEQGLSFSYKHYGPFSEELASAAREASLLGMMTENEQVANWGGSYSTYTTEGVSALEPGSARIRVAREAAAADAVELELAATALFLAQDGFPDPWKETERRKPEKAEHGRLAKARELYKRLSAIPVPMPWPNL